MEKERERESERERGIRGGEKRRQGRRNTACQSRVANTFG